MVPSDWTPYNRPSDGELLGYLVGDDDRTVPLTLFGYPLAAAGSRADAVRVLESRGLAALADRWQLRTEDGREFRVLILTAFPDRIRVVRADYGVYDHLSEQFELSLPAYGLQPA